MLKKLQKGFSLLEALIVAAIVLIIVALVITSFAQHTHHYIR